MNRDVRKLVVKLRHARGFARVAVKRHAIDELRRLRIAQDRARITDAEVPAVGSDVVVVVITPELGFEAGPAERRTEVIANEVSLVLTRPAAGGVMPFGIFLGGADDAGFGLAR